MKVKSVRCETEVNYASILSGYVWQVKTFGMTASQKRIIVAGFSKNERRATRQAKRALRKHLKENS